MKSIANLPCHVMLGDILKINVKVAKSSFLHKKKQSRTRGPGRVWPIVSVTVFTAITRMICAG